MLNRIVINVGECDYQYDEIDGLQVAQNPLPEGATIEDRDIEYDEDRGWHEVGVPQIPTNKERITMLEDTKNYLLDAHAAKAAPSDDENGSHAI